MSIENTESQLNRFDYSYERKSELIEIKLGFGLRMNVHFSEDGNIKIEDKLVSWNILTGVLEMSIKGAIIYNFIGTVLLGFLFLFYFFSDFEAEKLSLLVMFLIVIFWQIVFTSFYLIKAGHMKHTLIRWNEN
ncbi:hypothetical protein ACFQ0R_00030 [Psychroflexus salinarum]|uniref:Uncharacterized protein n=1 Tax=Psychroflexus salinarum TaxID=546024 RepID=A0ABW3GMM6_9FLAO